MIDRVREIFQGIRSEIHKRIIGQDDVIEKLVICLLADGHALIEGVPGIAKTRLARTLAEVLDCSFKRIQFTPDLLPADIIGTEIFDRAEGTFKPRFGPVFANIVLADEINRATPKTQSALLECMEEKRVTIGERTYDLPRPFFVVATQNPIEQEGTFPLPEAQLDRFMMKIRMGYPRREQEKEIVLLRSSEDERDLRKVASADEIEELKSIVRKVYLDDSIADYIVEIVERTRRIDGVILGASPRAALHLALASKARAAIRGRDFVTPSDVRMLAIDVISHRLVLDPESQLRGLRSENIISRILEEIPIPKVGD